MEGRIGRLDELAVETGERLVRIEVRLEPSATKAELHEWSATMIKWIAGTVSGMSIAGITITTFVLNHAGPKPSAQVVPPVVSELPPPAAPAALPTK